MTIDRIDYDKDRELVDEGLYVNSIHPYFEFFKKGMYLEYLSNRAEKRDSWLRMDIHYLMGLMRKEIFELERKISNVHIAPVTLDSDQHLDNVKGAAGECLDVALFSMFLWHILRRRFEEIQAHNLSGEESE